MALTLTDLQTYSGNTYANAIKAQAKLNQTINQVSKYLCYPLGTYGWSDKGDDRAATTFDSVLVNATPDKGTNSGSVTLTKLTSKNTSIDVLYDTTPNTLTDAAPEVVKSGLGPGNHIVEYGNYIWDVEITSSDVSILPRDKTTGQYWHVYNYKGLSNLHLEPVNDVYQAVFIDCQDKIIEDVEDWTFHNSTLRLCSPQSYHDCSCKSKGIKVAVLGDWYIPSDIETVVFDLADGAISSGSSALAGTLKKETIGSYSYERFGDSEVTTSLEAQKPTLDQYRTCKDII